MDYFEVICLRLSITSYSCGIYPKKAVQPPPETDGGMRVNCKHLSVGVDGVQLTAGKMESFVVAEMEIHTLGNFDMTDA